MTDRGPGIAPEHHQRIFAPLVRLEANGNGLGLGLAIVCELMAAMGGACGVDSAPGDGSTFWVCLPRTADAQEDDVCQPSL